MGAPAATAAGAGSAVAALAWTYRHATSQAVRGWTAPVLAGRRHGPLWARTGGGGDTAVLLLHGLVSSGDLFGGAFDSLAREQRLVVPDLLGFGRSLDERRDTFSIDDHLVALDELAERAGVTRCRDVVIGAHSMGSSLALAWAARHPDLVRRVVCWGAPVYRSPTAARAQVSGSLMTRLFVLDTALARRACALSCRHRTAAGWLTALGEPRLPVPIARAVTRHTWPAYRDALRDLVIEVDWERLLGRAADHQIDVQLVWGDRDAIGDRHDAASIAVDRPSITVTTVPGADHQLPAARPGVCRVHLIGTARQPDRAD